MHAPTPAFPLLQADPAWRRIDLLSDVHLHADLPRTFAAWRDHLLGSPADAVLMLGDLFEVWVGDDARHGGFEAQCLDVLREASGRRWLGFLPGNRDFLVGDAMLADAGVQRLADPTVLQAFGARWLLTHGDALCLDDEPYQRFRAWTRDPATQQGFLARPLAERVTLSAGIRHASEAGRSQAPPEGGWADLDATAAVACLRSAGATSMLHGHTHRPGASTLAPGFHRQVLSDWDVDGPTPRAEVLRLRPDGLERMDPAAAVSRR